MASSSSSAMFPAVGAQQEDITPLPLIRCPRCNRGIIAWYISHTSKNPGRHFYKCQYHGTPICNFWKWEDKYIEYLVARWGHVFAPNPQVAIIDEQKAILLQNQADLKTIIGLLVGMMAAMMWMLVFKY